MTPGPDPDGATPLADEERAGLLADWIATREELNAVEQENVRAALAYLASPRRRPTVDKVLDDAYLRDVHTRMFAQVWQWAGTYRTTERNIGIDPWQVPMAVRDLVQDARYWLAPDTTWITPDEALCKLHHRLVAIHPFPNGNGRLARAYTDLLARAAGRPLFTWGARGDLQRATLARDAYLAALRGLDRTPDDRQALAALVAFARS